MISLFIFQKIVVISVIFIKIDNILTKFRGVIMIDQNAWKESTNVNMIVAKRLRSIRRKQKISQEQLWLISGISLGSIKRFERTGDISFKSLIKIASALGRIEDFKNLFN